MCVLVVHKPTKYFFWYPFELCPPDSVFAELKPNPELLNYHSRGFKSELLSYPPTPQKFKSFILKEAFKSPINSPKLQPTKYFKNAKKEKVKISKTVFAFYSHIFEERKYLSQ